jgi:hypothetical protein
MSEIRRYCPYVLICLPIGERYIKMKIKHTKSEDSPFKDVHTCKPLENKNVISNLVRTTRFWNNLFHACSKSKDWKAK